MSDLTWITKRSGVGERDVTISIVKSSHSNNGVCSAFRFRNNSYLRITKNDFIEFAVTDSRIYFRESNNKDGFKLTSKSNNDKNASLKTVVDLSQYIGDYDLMWDKELQLNYIKLKEEVKN